MLVNSVHVHGFFIKSEIQKIKKNIEYVPELKLVLGILTASLIATMYFAYKSYKIFNKKSDENNQIIANEVQNNENNTNLPNPIDYVEVNFTEHIIKLKPHIIEKQHDCILDFEKLKSQIPDEKSIKEVREFYQTFDRTKGISIYNQNTPYTRSEIICACIKEISTNRTNLNPFYINRFMQVFGVWQDNSFFYFNDQNCVDVCLSYFLMQKNRELFFKNLIFIISWGNSSVTIITHLREWIAKAIEENNDELFDFCVKYYKSLEELIKKDTDNQGYYTFLLDLGPKVQELRDLLYSLPEIEQLLERYEITKKAEEFYDTVAQGVFSGLHQFKNKEQINCAKDILFLSEKFKNKKLDELCTTCFDSFSAKINDYYDHENDLICWNILYQEIEDDNVKKSLYQTFFNRFHEDFNLIYENKSNNDNGEKFFKAIIKYRFLLYLAAYDEEKKIALIEFLPKIIECLLDKNISKQLKGLHSYWLSDLFRASLRQILHAIHLLNVNDLSLKEKIKLSQELDKIILDNINIINDLGCTNIFLKIYHDMFTASTTFSTIYESEIHLKSFDKYNEQYISLLIKKLFKEGTSDFDKPIILDVNGIFFSELFKLYFSNKYSKELINDCLGDILLTDNDLVKWQRLRDYFNIKIPLSLEKNIKTLCEDQDSVFKKYLTQNSTNFIYIVKNKTFCSDNPSINKALRFAHINFLFKEESAGKTVFDKLTTYYDCFKNLLQKSKTIRVRGVSTKNAKIPGIKTILLEEKICMFLNILNNYYNEQTSTDFIEFFKNQHCSFKEINLLLDNIYIKEHNRQFLSFLFSSALPRISGSKYKQLCINKLVDLFKQNKYPIEDIFYENIKNNMDLNFYKAGEAGKINTAKAIILSEKQKNLTGFDPNIGFNILHVLMWQKNINGIYDLVRFLKEQNKVTLLKKLLETKAAPQLRFELKDWVNKTPVERVKELVNIDADSESYQKIQNIFCKAKNYLDKIQ